MAICETDRWSVATPDNMTLIELWQHIRPQLQRLVRSMGLSLQVAEDILQEVYLTAAEKCPSHFNTDQRRLWLIRVVANRCRLEYRRRKRWKTLLMRWTQSGSTATHKEIDITERDEQRTLIRKAIESLEPTQRLVLILKYYMELNSSQISEVLNMPDSTVRSHLRKARWRLAEKLKQTDLEP